MNVDVAVTCITFASRRLTSSLRHDTCCQEDLPMSSAYFCLHLNTPKKYAPMLVIGSYFCGSRRGAHGVGTVSRQSTTAIQRSFIRLVNEAAIVPMYQGTLLGFTLPSHLGQALDFAMLGSAYATSGKAHTPISVYL